jgi:hypothetical protein
MCPLDGYKKCAIKKTEEDPKNMDEACLLYYHPPPDATANVFHANKL